MSRSYYACHSPNMEWTPSHIPRYAGCMTLAELSSRLGSYVYDLETADRLTRVGLTKEANLAAVQAEYADLFTKERLGEARRLWEHARADDRDVAKRLYLTLVDGYLYHAVAAQDDALTTALLQTTVKIGDEEIPYFNLQPRWVKEPDFAARERLYAASLEVHRKHASERQEQLAAVLGALTDDLGQPDYIKWQEWRKSFKYQPFLAELRTLAGFLQPVYRQAMGGRSEAVLGKPLGECSAVHAGYLIQFPELDGHFPKDRLVTALEKTLAALGMPLGDQPNIQLDAADRPNKNPRAFCAAPNPPEEVHLVIKPIGGIYDYEAFFHEAGHALHFAHASATLPLAHRLFSTSHALTEVYSYLFEHLIYDENWLQWALGLSTEAARETAALTRLGNLYMLQRYIAKLDYELEFFQKPADGERNRQLYAHKLSEATGFVHPPENFLEDMDGGFYSADYLRAWVTQAQLTEWLAGEYGPRWFTQPAAGAWLRELWAEGTKPENEDIATRIGATPHDTTALRRFYETGSG